MSANTIVNGVDTGRLSTLAEHLAADASAGDTVWRANVVWKDGFRNEVRIRDLDPIYADEPELLGGGNSAPNPVEQLLGALGTCLAIGYTANASVRGIELKDLRIELEGHIDLPVFLGIKEGYAGYPEVTLKVHLDADASPDTLRELHEHVLATSPVGNTIQNRVGLEAQLVTE